MPNVVVAGFSSADINAASVLAGPGGTVNFENGLYDAVGLAVAFEGQRWHLDYGARLQKNASAVGPLIKIIAQGFELRGGTLDGNRASTLDNACGIDSSGFSFDGRDFTLTGVRGWGVAIDNADMKLIDVSISDTLNAGVIWRNTNARSRRGPHIERVRVDRSQEPLAGFASGGILVSAVGDRYVMSPRIVNCDVQLASQSAYDAVCIEMLRAVKGHIAGCNHALGRIGVSLGGDSYSTVADNAGQAQQDYAYEIAGCTGTTLAGNNASGYGPSHWGVRVTGGSIHVRGSMGPLVGFVLPVEILPDCSDCVVT